MPLVRASPLRMRDLALLTPNHPLCQHHPLHRTRVLSSASATGALGSPPRWNGLTRPTFTVGARLDGEHQ